MSEEQLERLTIALNSDRTLQSRIRAARSPEQVVAIAAEHGHMITVKEAKGMAGSSEELSDAQLEGVTGGKRRAQFTQALVSEVKIDSLDANGGGKKT
jgi:predicted ribosomally synthesized peptide with nif11-like leader